MKILADTHLLLWVLDAPDKVPKRFDAVLRRTPVGDAVFSVASICEWAIKAALKKIDFESSPADVRIRLLDADWRELPVTGAHAVAVADLPAIHGDPFDRLLVAQAVTEGLTLFTSDAAVARYGGAIELV